MTKPGNVLRQLGFPLLGLCLIVSLLLSLQFFMNRMLRQDALIAGMRWAENVEKTVPDIKHYFDGNGLSDVAANRLEDLSRFGQIYRYEFINTEKKVVFATGAYHPPAEGQKAEHHSHSHDQPNDVLASVSIDNHSAAEGHGNHIHAEQWLGFADFEMIISKAVWNVTNLFGSTSHEHRDLASHAISLRQGDGVSEPHYYAAVAHPIEHHGELAGVIQVYLDQTEKHDLYARTLYMLLIIISVATSIGFGLPVLSYLRSRKETRQAQEKAAFNAKHDAMTGLLNRSSFTDLVNSKLAEAAGLSKSGKSRSVALHFVDLDNFKNVNDSFGHDTGDELLRLLSERVPRFLPEGAVAGRVGGDEFAVLQLDFASEADIKDFAGKIQSAFSGTYNINGFVVSISSSIGVAIGNNSTSSFRDLMKLADIALYCVKEQGKNSAAIFKDEMLTAHDRRAQLEQSIRDALENDSFELHYQPLYQSLDNKLFGFEALIRLKDREGNPISPVEFIPLAEKMGLMPEIGRWVLREATVFASGWPSDLKISINLSACQFESGSLVDEVREALAFSKLDPHRLELEITEGLILENTEANMKQLHALSKLGCSIAMDDFGTGYSSLSYLWRFPFDRIKIDRSFVQGLGEDSQKVLEILQTIITLGHSLNMSVTAEGVESDAQLSVLQGMGCDLIQGFLLGKPQSSDKLPSLILNEFRHKAEDMRRHDVGRETGT